MGGSPGTDDDSLAIEGLPAGSAGAARLKVELAPPAGGNKGDVGTGWGPDGAASFEEQYGPQGSAWGKRKAELEGLRVGALKNHAMALGISPSDIYDATAQFDYYGDRVRLIDFIDLILQKEYLRVREDTTERGWAAVRTMDQTIDDLAERNRRLSRASSTTFSEPSPPAKSDEPRCIDVKDKKHCKLEDGCFWNDAKKSCAPSGLKPRHREVLRR
jgi:hypothetical protein